MTWQMPSFEEQQKMVKGLGDRVAYLTGKTVWGVQSMYILGDPPRTICVVLKSESSGMQRTAWPWDLKKVF